MTAPVDTTDTAPVASWHHFTALGITYRQYDWWCRAGYLRTIGDQQPGNGIARRHDPAELEVARVMVRLLSLGFLLGPAAALARDPQERERVAHRILDIEE